MLVLPSGCCRTVASGMCACWPPSPAAPARACTARPAETCSIWEPAGCWPAPSQQGHPGGTSAGSLLRDRQAFCASSAGSGGCRPPQHAHLGVPEALALGEQGHRDAAAAEDPGLDAVADQDVPEPGVRPVAVQHQLCGALGLSRHLSRSGVLHTGGPAAAGSPAAGGGAGRVGPPQQPWRLASAHSSCATTCCRSVPHTSRGCEFCTSTCSWEVLSGGRPRTRGPSAAWKACMACVAPPGGSAARDWQQPGAAGQPAPWRGWPAQPGRPRRRRGSSAGPPGPPAARLICHGGRHSRWPACWTRPSDRIGRGAARCRRPAVSSRQQLGLSGRPGRC